MHRLSFFAPQRVFRTLAALAAVSLFSANSAPSSHFCAAAEPTDVAAWNFDADADATAWSRNHLATPTVENGVFKARFEGWDPFVVSPQFELKPRPGQFIEIRLKSSSDGVGELFYASSNEGQYGGFSQAKSLTWTIKGGSEFAVYQIAPNWLAEPQIIKFRVDFGRPTEQEIAAGRDVEIDYIKIIDLNVENAEPVATPDWRGARLDALRDAEAPSQNVWRSEVFALDPAQVGSNLYFEWERDESVPDETPFPLASLRFLTLDKTGVVAFDVPIFDVGEQFDATSSYARFSPLYAKNVDLALFAGWGGRAYRWEVALPKNCQLRRLSFSPTPQGRGAFDVQLAGPKNSLPRLDAKTGTATVDFDLTVRNAGGAPITDLVGSVFDTVKIAKSRQVGVSDAFVKLVRVSAQKTAVDPLFGTNPTGDRLAFSRPDDSNVDKTVWTVDANAKNEFKFPSELALAPGEALRLTATFEAPVSGQFAPTLVLTGLTRETSENAQNFTSRLRPRLSVKLPFEILPPPKLAPASYVPEPRPVKSEYEIGAYYFPGWSRRSGWDKVDATAPIRRPLLGYYDESNPEVVDWQIKWAVENGIQFFFVDWYWSAGRISLDHWVKAFYQAKYKKYLKWAVMWANHNGPGTHSEADWRAVTQFWLDNYFKTPEYYQIDGKPVVVIWDPAVIDSDMIAEAKKNGVELKPGEGLARAFQISRDLCVEAGLKGVYFVAMKWPEHATDAATIQKLADATFDATTIYHYMHPGDKVLPNPKLYPFDDVVSSAPAHWSSWEKAGVLPFIPNLSTGWDSRPWHGFRQTVVYDRDAEKFRKHCADFKEFADKTGVKRFALGPVNEWGEGSYAEPNREFGFGMYEAVRDVFCEPGPDGFPANFAPSEVGLGPYDLPPTP
ncbi:MAG: glycoside hydrolase family 99-like domain-containing protein [Thermoguttaceae bacterium]|nr:glycoside hydrolase family 99-like domain-containing protein [Thermoguttaceae bacterium]